MSLNDEIVRPGGLHGGAPVSGARPRAAAGRTLGPRLRRYLVRALALPTGLALLGLGAAYLTRSLLAWSDWVVNRGLGAEAVASLALHQLVPVLAQVLPFATLIGVLSGLGHLRSTGELMAVETAGVSPRRLVRPVVAFAGGLSLIGLVLSLWLAPASRAQRAEAMLRMLAEHPGATLSAGRVHEFGDHRLTAREVSSSGERLRGVVLWSPELGETLFAERASVTPLPTGGIELQMHDATALLGPAQGGGQIEVGAFRTALNPDEAGLGDPEEVLAAAPPGELRRLGRASDPEASHLARAELHRRVALPLAGVILALASVPLALGGRGSSRTAGAVWGIGLTVAYYGLVQIGNGLLREPQVPVALAIWLPNALVAGVAALALARTTGSAGARGRGPRRVRVRGPAVPLPPLGRFILPRYVALLFVQLACVCFAALFVGYLLVDVLERLEWFARHHSTSLEAVRFYLARAPLLMSRVGPMSLLAAASLTISQLERRGELIAMQACGLSLLRSLAPISAVALLAAPTYFLVTDRVVPHTNALADHLKVTEIKDDAPAEGGSRFVWYRAGGSLLQADRMDRGRGLATDVTIYELDDRGFPRSRIDAREAHALGGGEWELVEPRRVEISGFGVSEAPAETRIQLGSEIAEIDPMHLGVRGLAEEIRRARADGYRTTPFEVDLQARLAAPFSCILLPWIAIAGALRSRAARSASRSLMLAVVLAVAFELLGDVSLSLGYSGRMPPAVAAWGPVSALALLASGLAWRASR